MRNTAVATESNQEKEGLVLAPELPDEIWLMIINFVLSGPDGLKKNYTALREVNTYMAELAFLTYSALDPQNIPSIKHSFKIDLECVFFKSNPGRDVISAFHTLFMTSQFNLVKAKLCRNDIYTQFKKTITPENLSKVALLKKDNRTSFFYFDINYDLPFVLLIAYFYERIVQDNEALKESLMPIFKDVAPNFDIMKPGERMMYIVKRLNNILFSVGFAQGAPTRAADDVCDRYSIGILKLFPEEDLRHLTDELPGCAIS